MDQQPQKKEFVAEFRDRLRTPWASPMFIGYLVVMILGGCVGVGATVIDVIHSKKIFEESFKIAESLATFFVAVAATALADMIYCETLGNKKAFQLWTAIAIGFCVFLLWLTYEIKSRWSFFPSVAGTMLALLVWVIANSDNKNISEEDTYSKEMRGEGIHGNNWK